MKLLFIWNSLTKFKSTKRVVVNTSRNATLIVLAQHDINCYKAISVGEQSLQAVGIEITKFSYLKLKRCNIAKTMSLPTSKVKVGKDVVEGDTTQLFQRMLCTVHAPDDLQECFTYELSTVPMSLFESSGLMRKAKKSALYGLFDKVPERPPHIDNNFVFVFDGGSLIHRGVWPIQGNFGDIYCLHVSYIRKHYGQEVKVVFDGYSMNGISTKSLERQRHLMNRTSGEVIFNECTTIVKSQREFLTNLTNKERFISQLALHLDKSGIHTFIAEDDADLNIVKTAIETSETNNKLVAVVGQDEDLLVLIMGLTPDNMNVLMLKEGKGNVKDRWYSSQDLQKSKIVLDCKESMLFLHAISGCDTTSGFYGKGKLQAIQVFNRIKSLQDITRVLNISNSNPEEVEKAGEEFTKPLYNKTTEKEDCLNKIRYNCFNRLVDQGSATVILSRLPPNSGAMDYHELFSCKCLQTATKY